MKYADKLIRILSQKDKLSYKQIKTLNYHYRKSKHFTQYIPINKLIKSMHTHRRVSEKIKLCSEFNQTKYIIQKEIESFCHFHINKRFTKKIRIDDFKKILTHKDAKYISSSNISKMLTRIRKKNLKTWRKTSRLVSQFYIQNNLTVSTRLLKAISINDQFYQYANKAGLGDSKSKKTFLLPLSDLYKDFKNKIKNKKYDDALNISEHFISFYNENKKHIKLEHIKDKLIAMGRSFAKAKQSDYAEKTYADIMYLSNMEKELEVSNEAVFYLLWQNISKNNFLSAREKIRKYNLLDRYSTFNPRLKFWIAFVCEKTKETDLSHYLYTNIISHAPLSYYSIISLDQIKKQKKSFDSDLFISKDNEFKMSLFNAKTQEQINRSKIWFKIYKNNIANREIKKILSSNQSDLISKETLASVATAYITKGLILTHISNYLTSKQKYLTSFKLVYRSMNSSELKLTESMMNTLFPVVFLNQIKSHTKVIDPFVILSLIRQESAFNPRAKSLPGARGLMQLMPKTAYELKPFKEKKQLYNPDLNIQLGIKYFEKLMKKFDKNLIYSLAAYNAGPHRVSQWKKNAFKNKNPLIQIDSIPFKETSSYVKLIYRNIFFYKLLQKQKLSKKNLALIVKH